MGYKKGEDGVRRPSNGIEEDITIYRYYGAVEIEGKIYRTKTTIKRTNYNNTQRVYTYEITKIELLGGKTDVEKSNTPTPNNSISFANLLKDVENDKRVWKPKTLYKSILCHRYYSAVSVDGNEYRVMVLVKESRPTNTEHKITPYTVEVQAFEIEKIKLSDVPVSRTNHASNGEMASNNFTLVTKLLQGVEKFYDKGKKVLEESKNSSYDCTNPDIRFRFGGNSGYVGYSMSVRAAQAREEFEKVIKEKNSGILSFRDWKSQQANEEGVRFSLGEKDKFYHGLYRKDRKINNFSLTIPEKVAIRKYIMSLPEDTDDSKPLYFENNGYIYKFNTLLSSFEDNLIDGDGFEIIDKLNLNKLTDGERKDLQRGFKEDTQTITEITDEFETSGRSNLGDIHNFVEGRTTVQPDGVVSGRIEEENSIGGRDSGESTANSRDGEITPFDSEAGVNFRLVEDPELIEKLESEPTIKVYRAMQLVDGKLYPPMSAKVNGEWRTPSPIGVWEEAEENPELADDKGYFKLDKGNKTSLKARYNPYFHTSRTPLNDQFSSAQDRPELVTVEVEVPLSELTSGYKAEKAKDAVGELEWKAGVVQGKLSGTRKVILSRWSKPVRVVPDSEVAQRIVEMFGDREITMPSNVVTPSLRAELEKLGVPFVETDNQGKPTETRFRLSEETDNILTRIEQESSARRSKV